MFLPLINERGHYFQECRRRIPQDLDKPSARVTPRLATAEESEGTEMGFLHDVHCIMPIADDPASKRANLFLQASVRLSGTSELFFQLIERTFRSRGPARIPSRGHQAT